MWNQDHAKAPPLPHNCRENQPPVKQQRKIKLKVHGKPKHSTASVTTTHPLSRKQSALGESRQNVQSMERNQSEKRSVSPSINFIPPTKQPRMACIRKEWQVESLAEQDRSMNSVGKRLATNLNLTIDLTPQLMKRVETHSTQKREDRWHKKLARNNSRENHRVVAAQKIKNQLLGESLEKEDLVQLLRGCDLSGESRCRWGVLAVDLMYSRMRRGDDFKSTLRA